MSAPLTTGTSPTVDLTIFIRQDGKDLGTDSRAVAIAFNRRHADVLKTIDRMFWSHHQEIREHAQRNFSSCSYIDPNGRCRPFYRMTDKGMSELAMGFTGDLSRVVRIRFLNAFEEVSERLLRAETSITAQLLDLERREMPSKVRGQIGSQLMNDRRREKPEFVEQRRTLEELAQPELPGVDVLKLPPDTTVQ